MKRPAAVGLHPVAELPETKKLTQCMSFSSVGMGEMHVKNSQKVDKSW
jgi:hypothetical protein